MKDKPNVKRLSLQLHPDVDRKLREVAAQTGLKLVTVISQGIERIWEERVK